MTGLGNIALNQAKNVVKLAIGKPLVYPSFGSVTLDQDDVDLARDLLANPAQWYDESVAREYEQQFAEWNESRAAYSFMAGRVALSACLYALDARPGDEVIVPGYTCVVVANAIRFAGLRCRFADIELETQGPDVDSVRALIGENTRAIILQHLFGLVCRDYEAIIELAREHNICVIEDCAHATGARFRNQRVGNLGDMAFYSSEQSKIFSTMQGGVATTNNMQLAERISEYQEQAGVPDEDHLDRQLNSVILNYYRFKHPQRWFWADIYSRKLEKKLLVSTSADEESGIQPANYQQRMPAAIARIGMNQLKKIDDYNRRRRETAVRWDNWCDQHGYTRPRVLEHSEPVFLRYPVLVEPERKAHRNWSYSELKTPVAIWFCSQLHPSPEPVSGCPNAEVAVARCINLPTLLS